MYKNAGIAIKVIASLPWVAMNNMTKLGGNLTQQS